MTSGNNKILIEVKKNHNENNASLVRRFSRKMQESRNIPKAKSLRFNLRTPSKLAVKQNALRKIEKRKEREHLRKLGKIK